MQLHMVSQQAPGIHLMLFICWPTVFDAGPTLELHRVIAPCLLGCVWLSQFHSQTPVTTFILPENQSRIRGVVVSERGEKNVKWAEFDV